MKLRTFISVSLLFSIALTSCKKELEPQESSVPMTAAAPESPAPPQAETAPTMTASPQPSMAAAAPTAPGMNPAHGQPGHRCDIAVGAPLSGAAAPAQPQKSAVSISPDGKISQDPNSAVKITQAPIPTPTAATTTKPGMNPAHGQPGHRCDIAVGAPLSSAPAKTAAATINSSGEVSGGNGNFKVTTKSGDATPALLQAPAEESK